MSRVENIIKELELQPHPEGGYFKETYRSIGVIEQGSLGQNFNGDRNYATCIYFLLTSDTFSAFHRIQQDEIWHFYQGSAIHLHTISESGEHQEFLIGKDFSAGQRPQLIVPGNHWFAAAVIEKNAYALVGCTVSPGFDFGDFELADRKEMVQAFPQHKKLIMRFTRA
jgi:predicted cupin superfamily sugar epimerase